LIGAASIADIPRNGRVGSASQRRQAQLLAVRPDHKVVLFRGNVATRSDKIAAGEADVTLLALAGLKRLGRADAANAILNTDEMLPSAGQGVIMIARCEGNEAAAQVLAPLNHAESLRCLLAERAMLDTLDGTCRTPIGGLAQMEGDLLRLNGLVAWPDGSNLVRHAASGPPDDPEALGRAVGQVLRDQIGPDFFADHD
jgi:hydroxymethylbilane synthase